MSSVPFVSSVSGRPGARAAVADYLGKPIASVRLVHRRPRHHRAGADTTSSETRAGSRCRWSRCARASRISSASDGSTTCSVDATLEGGRRGAPLRADADSSRLEDPVRRHARACPASTTARCAAPSSIGTAPRRRSAASADLTRIRRRRAARARLSARRRSRRAPRSSTTPSARRWCSRSIPGRGRRSARSRSLGPPADARRGILDRLGLAPGAPYQREALNARIERYIDDRRSARLLPGADRAGGPPRDDDRVANLTLTVTPGPTSASSSPAIRCPADARAELVPIEREGSADEDLLEDSSNRIEEYLRAQGYRDATAPHTREDANGELLITFAVTRGPQYRVATFEISGNASLPLAGLRAGLRLRDGEPFSAARLDADVPTLEDLYRRRGFAGGEGAAAVEVVSRRRRRRRRFRWPCASSSPKACARRWTAVTFAGNQSVPEDDASPARGLQPGAPYVPGSSPRPRRDSARLSEPRVRERHRRRQARVQPGRHARGRGVHVREGPQVFVDHVLIVGNVRTSAETIERELQVKPGDPLSLSADQREPAAADRARPVPPRAHHRAAARRRDHARSAGDRRGSGRRRRWATAAASRGELRVVGQRRRAASPANGSRSRRGRSSRSAAGTCSARTDR